MPFHRVADLGSLGGQLLDIIFSEQALTGKECLGHI